MRNAARRTLALLSTSGLMALAACQTYQVENTRQFYEAVSYAPHRLSATAVPHDQLAEVCGAGEGVETLTYWPNVSGVTFAATPGMTLQVRQAQARLSGASDIPVLSAWTWRIPNTVASGCAPEMQWSDTDSLVARVLAFGARVDGALPAPGPATPQIGSQALWVQSLRCAVDGTASGVPGCKVAGSASTLPQKSDALKKNLFEPVSQGLLFEVRANSNITPDYDANTGLAASIAALCAPQLSDFGGPAGDWKDLSDCADPAVWSTGKAPDVCTKQSQRRLITVGGGNVPLLSTPLELLASGDPLLAAEPRAVSLVNPSFDLMSGKPGSGGGPGRAGGPVDVQTPLAGNAYQGFVDVNLMIPVRVVGRKDPMLAPVCSTVGGFGRQLGHPVLSVGRLPQWLPRTMELRTGSPPRTVSMGYAQLIARDGHVYLKFYKPQNGDGGVFFADAGDVLLAPGDIVTLEP